MRAHSAQSVRRRTFLKELRSSTNRVRYWRDFYKRTPLIAAAGGD